jgi:hypothetical protein
VEWPGRSGACGHRNPRSAPPALRHVAWAVPIVAVGVDPVCSVENTKVGRPVRLCTAGRDVDA